MDSNKTHSARHLAPEPPLWRLLLPLVLVLSAVAVWWFTAGEAEPPLQAPALTAEQQNVPFVDVTTAGSRHYVGRQSCIACHVEQSAEFVGSHHDQAMQEANADTAFKMQCVFPKTSHVLETKNPAVAIRDFSERLVLPAD